MPLQIVNDKEIYEREYRVGEEPYSVFLLKKLSMGEVNSINDQTVIQTSNEDLKFLGGTSTKMKIKYAVTGWKNVVDSQGKDVPCNEMTKEKLPPSVALWLISEIDKLNGFGAMSEEERKNLS